MKITPGASTEYMWKKCGGDLYEIPKIQIPYRLNASDIIPIYTTTTTTTTCKCNNFALDLVESSDNNVPKESKFDLVTIYIKHLSYGQFSKYDFARSTVPTL